MLNKFAHRFLWKTDTVRFSPFLIFFTIQNLAIGLLFAFGGYIGVISELKLFITLTTILPSPLTASLWGAMIILLFVGHCLEMYFRGKGIGPPIAMAGIIIWVYAFYIYAAEFSLMALIGIVSPQLMFWVWYYVSAKAYRRDLLAGKIESVS